MRGKWVISLVFFLSLFFAGIASASEWARTYGGMGKSWASSIQQTSDGSYIVAGWTTAFGAGGGGDF